MATRRYAALLRGVSPVNARMPELAAAFEAAGFTEVRTVLSSGNVLFSAPRSSEAVLVKKAEAAMARRLGKPFPTLVREVAALQALLEDDPWAALGVPGGAKRVVTFLRAPPASPPRLPIAQDGAHLLALRGRELLSAYLPGPKGPVFMQLIEKAFGKEVTTRTWDTVARLAR